MDNTPPDIDSCMLNARETFGALRASPYYIKRPFHGRVAEELSYRRPSRDVLSELTSLIVTYDFYNSVSSDFANAWVKLVIAYNPETFDMENKDVLTILPRNDSSSLGISHEEGMPKQRDTQKMKRHRRLKINYHPRSRCRNGSNGYEDKGFAKAKRFEKHGYRETWLAARNGKGGYSLLRFELTGVDQTSEPPQESREENPYYTLYKQYGTLLQKLGELVQSFAYYRFDDKNYFIADKTLALLEKDRGNIREEDIDLLLARPDVKSLEKNRNVFVIHEKELSRIEQEPIHESLEYITCNLWGAADKITPQWTTCQTEEPRKIGRAFDVI